MSRAVDGEPDQQRQADECQQGRDRAEEEADSQERGCALRGVGYEAEELKPGFKNLGKYKLRTNNTIFPLNSKLFHTNISWNNNI